ncbi:MAG: hypothetical protein HC809_05900 [Gammaproteobacteria bacterium]|nr:hypothetical protein [Gammaproteobacteria bacterium]
MTLTLAQAITVAILAISCFFCGWFFNRLRAKAREAELQRTLLDTKGVIPQLESSLRNRDQRVSALCTEVGDWKNRHASAESSLKEKERDILARDRALRSLNSELTMLKESQAELAARDAPVDADRLATLEAALADAQGRCADLQRRLDSTPASMPEASASGESAVAAEASNESAAQIDALQVKVATLEGELAARDTTLGDLETRLKAESMHAGGLGEQIDAQAEEIARGKEELAKWRARVPKLVESIRDKDLRLRDTAAAVEALNRDLAAATARSEAAAEELARARAQIAETAEQLAALRSRDALAQQERAVLDETLSAIRAEVSNRDRELSAREGELARVRSQLEQAQRGMQDAQAEFAKKLATSIRLGREEVDRLNREADRLTHELGAALTAQHDSAEARATLDEVARSRALELERLQSERDAAVTAQSTLAEECAALRDRQSGLTAECERLELRIPQVEGDLTAALERIAALDSAHSGLLAEAASRAAAIEERDAEFAELREELREWHARFAPLESTLKQRDAALQASDAQIENLRAQIAELDAALAEGKARASQRERELREREQNVVPVEANDAKAEYLETRVVNQIEKNRELTAALEERNKSLATLEKDRDLKDKSLTVLRQQLEQERETIDRLAAQLREARAQISAPPTVPETPDDSVAAVMPRELFTTATADKDDLQSIRGIGAAFEHRLNVLGVYQYRQIAGLSDAEIVWLENELKTFRGRIGRDDWIGQAVALMRPPPGTASSLASSQTL